MYRIYRLNFSHALFYTTLLTLCQGKFLSAMEMEKEDYTPHSAREVSISFTDFAQKFSNPFREKSREVIEVLNSITPKSTQNLLNRYDQVQAKRFNLALKNDNQEATRQFSEILKNTGISPEQVSKLAHLTYGFQKLGENYDRFMLESFRKEKDNLKKGIVTDGGYASDFIDPQNRKARARFLKDASAIFGIREETSRTLAQQAEKARFDDFSSFIKIYLGV